MSSLCTSAHLIPWHPCLAGALPHTWLLSAGFAPRVVSKFVLGMLEVGNSAKTVACLAITTASWVFIKKRFIDAWSPVMQSSWVDWWYPPKTLTHEVSSADGKVKKTANEFKDIFTMKSFMLDRAYLAEDNQHKYAARRRLAAVKMAQAIAKRIGKPIHDDQMSRRSSKQGLAGTRTLMCAKDACSYVAEDLKFERVQPGSIVTHIDTFTHKDLRDANNTLSDGNIHFIYTWNPDCVAGKSDEINFRYDEEGNFITDVEGSDPYCDQLWDFEGDCLVTYRYESAAGYITSFFLTAAYSVFCYNLFANGFKALSNAGPLKLMGGLLSLAMAGSYNEPTAYCHKVIRLDVGEHRSIAVVVPNCKFKGLAATFRPFLSEAELRPRKPIVGATDGGHRYLAEQRKSPGGLSVAFLDSNESHFVSDAVINMSKALTTGKGAPSLANVRVSSKYEGDEPHRVAVAIAIAITNKDKSPQSYSSNYGFYPLPTIIRQDDDAKADGQPIKEVMAHGAMPPIVTGAAFIHAKSEQQTRDFVQRRLRDPAGRVRSTFTPQVAEYIREFAMHIRQEIGGSPGYLEPISEEEYEETRNKNQLNKFHGVLSIYDIHNYDDRQGFMKREVLSDPTKAGRGICTFPPESQALGGRIALAYAAAMKACPWMACGLNPAETTQAVVRVCSGKKEITGSDFSAQDATIDENKRCVELMLLLQLFDLMWHALIQDWHYTDYCGRVLYGDPGTQREAHEFEGSRGSGSPFTTLGNTPLTGLFAYVALRLSGQLPPDAWANLGIYSGDDGITADLPPEFCVQAAEALGFLAKTTVRCKYIPFLGRDYFDPIGGSNSSIQSPLRTASKLHTTLLNIEGEFTAEETMIMKAICLQVTDKHSDFFGPWSKKILEEAGKKQANSIQNLKTKVLKYPGLHPYFAITALKTQETFHNSPGDFEELFEEQMPGFDWSVFNNWLKNGDGPCPMLWEHPEFDDGLMEAVAPVTIAVSGVSEERHMIEYLPPNRAAKGVREKSGLFPPPNWAAKGVREKSGLFPPEDPVKKKVTFAKKPEIKEVEKVKLPFHPRPRKNGAPPAPKRNKHRQTADKHKKFLGHLEELGLLDEYRAAKIVDTDPDDARKAKRKVRAHIAQIVQGSVQVPRSR